MRVVWGGIWDELCLVLCGLSGSRDFAMKGWPGGHGSASNHEAMRPPKGNPSNPTFFERWLRKQTCLVHGMWHW
ncbi:hypothetical protein BR93DRAFT_927861 [Coniochaeta sp. PMI_546]|nr:hypothetical protein BR93DRAFT_927861 [Coniochaeta sp. PMI_546]